MATTQFAIVGHSCRFPGGANDPDQFWKLLSDGIETSTDLPKRCFDIEQVFEPPEKSRSGSGYRRMGVRKASLIDDAECFDAAFFGVSRREAKIMDPQQRQLLQVAHEAIEVSGYSPSCPTPSTNPETYGVYVAVATDDYVVNLAAQEVDVFYSPATLRTFLAGRLSHYFGWEGPSVTIDTACSSSIVTLHTACRALAAGDCRSALVAGVNVITSPDMFLGLYRGHFLSQDGRCKTFDASADGYGRAEGVAAFIVKTLDDALADGDHIEAIVCATALNQSGLSKSITHPDPATQVKLYRRINEMADVDASQISVVEMHGTGTKAGDRCEVGSVSTVYGGGGKGDTPLHLSSVKANVGHCEAAAGFAGLTKLLGMLRHRTIPAQISLKTLNPELKPFIEDSRIEIATEQQPWISGAEGVPRIALLNSFGAAGSNASAILQEYVRPAEENTTTSEPRQPGVNAVFCLSAKTTKALDALIKAYLEYIATHRETVSLGQLCYATMARRIHYASYRRAMPICLHDDWSTLETQLLAWQSSGGASSLTKLSSKPAPVLIPLLAELPNLARVRHHFYYERLAFRRAFEEVVGLIKGPDAKVESFLDAASGEEESEEYRNSKGLLSFAFQVAVVRQWQAWGLHNITLLCDSEQAETVAKYVKQELTFEEAWETYQSASHTKQQSLVTLEGAVVAAEKLPKGTIAVDIYHDKAYLMAESQNVEKATEVLKQASSEPDTASLLAKLYEYGVSLQYANVLEGQLQWPAPAERLPLHPFEKDALWVDYKHQPHQTGTVEKKREAKAASPTQEVKKPVESVSTTQRGYATTKSTTHVQGNNVCYAATMDVTQVRDEIMGHLVAGKGMCPASVYHELAFTTLLQYAGENDKYQGVLLKRVRYHAPLVYDDAAPGQLVCQLVQKGDYYYHAKVGWQRNTTDDRLQAHCTADIYLQPKSEADLVAVPIPEQDQLGNYIATEELYKTFAERVVDYAPLYQTIETLSRSSDGYEGKAQLKRGAFKPRGQYGDVVNPVLQDTMLHTAGYLANMGSKSSAEYSFIAMSLGSLVASLDSISEDAVEIRASTTWDERSASLKCRASAHDASGAVLAYLDELVFKRVDAKHFSAMLAQALAQKAKSKAEPKTSEAVEPKKLKPTKKTTKKGMKLDDEIRKIICEGTGVSADEIKGDTALEELGVDSLLFIETLEKLEEGLVPGASELQDKASAQQSFDEFAALCSTLRKTDGADEEVEEVEAEAEEAEEDESAKEAEHGSEGYAVTTEEGAAKDESEVTRELKKSASSSSARDTAIEVLARILAIDDVSSLSTCDSSMEELGLDSLGSLELSEGLSRDLHVEIAPETLAGCESVTEFCDMVTAELPEQPGTEQYTKSNDEEAEIAVEPQQVPADSVKEGQSSSQEKSEIPPETEEVKMPAPAFYETVSSSQVAFLRRALRLSENPRLVRRGTSHTAVPLFLCADGSGIPASYLTLPTEQSRDIWILHHERLFDPPSKDWGVVEHAAALVDAVQEAYPTGPLLVGGWSFGGILAWEMAYQLQHKLGRQVVGVLAIDTPCPIGHKALDASILDALLPETQQEEDGKSQEENRLMQARQLIRASFLKSGNCLERYANLSTSTPSALNAVKAMQQNLSNDNSKPAINMALLRCTQDFKARWATDPAFDWLTKRSSSSSGDAATKHKYLGWDRLLTSGLDIVLDIPGSHFTPFAKRNATAVSAAIEQACHLLLCQSS